PAPAPPNTGAAVAAWSRRPCTASSPVATVLQPTVTVRWSCCRPTWWPSDVHDEPATRPRREYCDEEHVHAHTAPYHASARRQLVRLCGRPVRRAVLDLRDLRGSNRQQAADGEQQRARQHGAAAVGGVAHRGNSRQCARCRG